MIPRFQGALGFARWSPRDIHIHYWFGKDILLILVLGSAKKIDKEDSMTRLDLRLADNEM